MKTCPTCGIKKETDQFHKAKSTKDGLNWQCKSCHKTRMRAQVERIAASEKVIPDEKHCTGCDKTKPSAAFSRNRVMLDGLSNWCKECDYDKHQRISSRNKDRKSIEVPREQPCHKCKKIKPSTEFCSDRTRRSGLSALCKECSAKNDTAAKHRYRSLNAEIDPHVRSNEKRCIDCEKVLPVSQFGKLLATARGLNPRCKTCRTAYGKSYANSNRERIMWLAARNRAKKQGVPFKIELSDIVIPERCPVLGVEWGTDRKVNLPSLDKIVPEKGYVKGNIVVMSMRANMLKSNATPEELRKLADFFCQ